MAPFLNRFSAKQKRNIAITFVAGIACLVAILWILLRPHYVTIMSGLSNKSLGQVQTKLEALKIPNEINGSSVLVPKSQANTARVQLATAGLPQSGYIGYSSIQSKFGMTQDQFNIQVLNLLQESLGQTIQSINGINGAQVHIVMPQKQLFVSQNTSTAEASVFVQLSPGTELSSAQVAGIQQLVAHSVKGLTTQSVSVVDQNGVTLSNSGGVGNVSGASTGEMGIRSKLEQQLQQQLQSELTTIVGSGNAVVSVHANVSFNQVKSTSKQYQPAPGQKTGLVASQQTTSSSSKSTNQSGGAAGQSSSNPNLPTYGTSGNGSNGAQSTKRGSTINYDNNVKKTTTVQDPMQIQGYNVGVVLNASDKQITTQEIAQIKQFVSTTVAGKGAVNSVFVSKMPFHPSTATSSLGNGGQSKTLLWAAIGGGVLLVGAGVLLYRRRKNKEEVNETIAPQALQDLEEQLEQAGVSPDEQMKRQLAKLAKQKPDEFANLVRTWLVSD
ncbi:flagellar M-ring protein FliF [Alicyclobacillus sp. SO9]|nr:flagellar M-ring protein FliF [Alicyclobacillus sp. SO9]